jgi:hypothetical protein
MCEWRLTSFSSRTAQDATTGDRLHLLLSQRTGELVFFLSRACSLICGQLLGPLPMTLLITFSWRFILILALERARRVNWGVTPHPAKVGIGVRKWPQAYFVDNIESRKPDLQTQQAEVLLSSAENTARFGLTASGWTLHGEVVRPKSRFQSDVTDTFQLAKQKHTKFLKEKRT